VGGLGLVDQPCQLVWDIFHELKSKHLAPGLLPLITHIFTAQNLHVSWFWGLKVGKLGGLEMIFSKTPACQGLLPV